MVAAIAEAVIGPKPGMLISRRAVSSFWASFAIVRSSRAIASSKFRNCTTSGRRNAAPEPRRDGVVSGEVDQRSENAVGRRALAGERGNESPTPNFGFPTTRLG